MGKGSAWVKLGILSGQDSVDSPGSPPEKKYLVAFREIVCFYCRCQDGRGRRGAPECPMINVQGADLGVAAILYGSGGSRVGSLTSK